MRRHSFTCVKKCISATTKPSLVLIVVHHANKTLPRSVGRTRTQKRRNNPTANFTPMREIKMEGGGGEMRESLSEGQRAARALEV